MKTQAGKPTLKTVTNEIQMYYSCLDPSIEVLFSDQRCYSNIGVCPSDTVNVTCKAFELTQTTLRVTIPPDDTPTFTVLYVSGNGESSNYLIFPPGQTTVVLQSVEEKNGTFNYVMTMSLTGSDLIGGPVVCSDGGDYTSTSSCRIAGEIFYKFVLSEFIDKSPLQLYRPTCDYDQLNWSDMSDGHISSTCKWH